MAGFVSIEQVGLSWDDVTDKLIRELKGREQGGR